MKILLEKLKPLGFNGRVLTEKDFHAICEKENILINWSNRKYSFYFSAFGQSCVTLPKRLKGLKLLFAMFHELGHHFAHVGDDPVVMWKDMPHQKDEFEADAIALIAMMPINLLREMAFLDGSRYGGKLWNERMRLYFLYGI